MSIYRDLTLVLRARNLASAEVRRLSGDLSSMKDLEAAQAAQSAATGAQQLRQGAVVSAVFLAAADAASHYETSLDRIALSNSGVVSSSAQVVAAIGDLTTQTGTSIGVLTSVAVVAEKLGVEGAANIANFTKQVDALATISGDKPEQLAVGVGKMLTALGEAPEHIGNVASSLAQLNEHFVASTSDVVAFATRVGPQLRALGLSTPEILGLSTALTQAGLSAGSGGQQIANVMDLIQKAVTNNSRQLVEYASVAGMSAKQFATAWKSDPLQAFMSLVEGIKASGKDMTTVLSDIGFTNSRTQRTFIDMAQALDLNKTAIDQAKEGYNNTGKAVKDAQTIWDSTKGTLAQLGQTLVEFGAALGGGVLIGVRLFAQGGQILLSVLNSIPGPLLTVIGIMGILFGVLRLTQGISGLVGAGFVRMRQNASELTASIQSLSAAKVLLTEEEYQQVVALAAETGMTKAAVAAELGLTEATDAAATAASLAAAAISTLGLAIMGLTIVGVVISLFQLFSHATSDAATSFDKLHAKIADSEEAFRAYVQQVFKGEGNIRGLTEAQRELVVSMQGTSQQMEELDAKLIFSGRHADEMKQAFQDLVKTDPAAGQRIINWLQQTSDGSQRDTDIINQYKSALADAISVHRQMMADQGASAALWGEGTNAIETQGTALDDLDSKLKTYASDLQSTFNTLATSFVTGADLGTYLSGLTAGAKKAGSAGASAANETASANKTAMRDIVKANQTAADETVKAWQAAGRESAKAAQDEANAISKAWTNYRENDLKAWQTYHAAQATAAANAATAIREAQDAFRKSMQATRAELDATVAKFFDFGRLTTQVTDQVSVASIMAMFADSSRAAGEWADDMATLVERGLSTGIIKQLEGMGDKALPIIRALVGATQDQINQLNAEFVPSSNLNTIVPALNDTAAADLATSLNKINTEQKAAVAAAGTTLRKQLQADKVDLVKALGAAQQAYTQRMAEIHTTLITTLSDISVRNAQSIADTMSRLADQIASIAQRAQTAVSNASGKAHQSLMEFLTQQHNDMETWLNGLKTLMDRGLSAAVLDQLAKLGPKGAPLIKQFLALSKTEIAKVNGMFSIPVGSDSFKALVALTANLTKMPNITREQAREILAAVKQGLKDFPNVVLGITGQAGTAAVQGFTAGVHAQIRAAQIAGEDTGNAFVLGLGHSLQVRSPSRVTYDMGVNTVLGFVNGIRNNMGLVAPQIDQLLNQAQVESNRALNVALRSTNPVGGPSAGQGSTTITISNGAVQLNVHLPNGETLSPAAAAQLQHSTESALTSVLSRVRGGTSVTTP